MLYSIESLRKEIYGKVLDVYDIFKDYFGEENVDLQGIPSDEDIVKVFEYWSIDEYSKGLYDIDNSNLIDLAEHLPTMLFILVHWPEVTVTNENNKSIKIWDLFAKIYVNTEGCIPFEYSGFYLNRTHYDRKQFESNYMHSHVQDVNKNSLTEFQLPCLGTGPIKNTICTLKTENSPEMWMLFCEELSRYVTVESLAGTPWRRLEEVGRGELVYNYIDYDTPNASYELFTTIFSKETYKKFIKYYLTHGHLSISYINGCYVVGNRFYDFMIDISNAFIEFYKNLKDTEVTVTELYRRELIRSVIAKDRKFYSYGRRNINNSPEIYRGKYVLTFKGKPMDLVIDEDSENPVQYTILLSKTVAQDILIMILKLININYKYNDNGNRGETSTVSKNVYYF